MSCVHWESGATGASVSVMASPAASGGVSRPGPKGADSPVDCLMRKQHYSARPTSRHRGAEWWKGVLQVRKKGGRLKVQTEGAICLYTVFTVNFESTSDKLQQNLHVCKKTKKTKTSWYNWSFSWFLLDYNGLLTSVDSLHGLVLYYVLCWHTIYNARRGSLDPVK